MIDVRDDLATALAGRYEIERELGHGGMAIVYLARDVRHDRHVAVKALRPELATTLGAERFLREINIAARLTHPNILALHDSGEAAGMLYFVMPHVEGESLRDRLDREHQLPMDEALAITRQIGLALDYAHERGVVHRDIKPENILLLGDHVLVADFGLARALYTAGTQRLTESAVAVGTPAYMSPEQAAADPDVDGRSDLYSLACVLFEMVAGMPPFKGATSAAVLAQHLTAKPPSICAQRPHCPPNVDAAVARALEKTPADRFRTAGEFVAALTGTSPQRAGGGGSAGGIATIRPPSTSTASRRRLVAFGAIATALVAAVVAWQVIAPRPHAALDTSSFVVLPLVATDAAARSDSATVARGLADALGEWEGVRVVDMREVTDEVAASQRSGALHVGEALGIARKFGAANLVWGEVGADGVDSASARVARVRLYDVRTGQVVRPAVLEYVHGSGSIERMRAAASRLLRGQRDVPRPASDGAYHPSLPAWLAYDSAQTLLSRWDVADAARQLTLATTIDKSFAKASLWLSLTQLWSGAPTDRWRAAARQAYASRDQLEPSDTAILAAQLALADGRYPDACAAYRRVIAGDANGVIGWFGLGECQSRDSLVIPDRSSPSGWRFRGSMHQAIEAYLRIVNDRAPPQPTFVYTRLSRLLYTSGVQLRPGHSSGPPRVEFGASPALDHDTLVFTPYPLDNNRIRPAQIVPPGKAAALERNRALLRRLYRAWASDAPSTVEAHEALANLLEALEELGDAGDDAGLSALAQIRSARRLSANPVERLRLARTELRILAKMGNWSGVASLTDSLFDANPRPAADTSAMLASAAAMSGRIRTLAMILESRDASSSEFTLPDGTPLDLSPALEQDAARTFAFALTGACVDSLRGYRTRIEGRLSAYMPDPAQRDAARGVLLRRPLSLAAPCVGPGALLGVDAASDRMVQLEQALAAKNIAEFERIYGRMAAARALNRPGDDALDYVYMESWMFAALGDSARAMRHLDEPLGALSTLGAYLTDYPEQSAALPRAMELRAELAAATGDGQTASRWAAAVATLWRNADPELQPYVSRMRGIRARFASQ